MVKDMNNKFKTIRENTNLSTEEAANLLGIRLSMLYKIEQGHRNPSLRLMKKMAEVYKCPVQKIFLACNITNSDLNLN